MSDGAGGLHVVDHHVNSAHGPLVVLVHGSLDRGTSFARVVRRLGDLRVVTYDRRGYERSRDVRPPATSLRDHIDDLLAVIDGRLAAVVGHSYGGDVALGAAVAAPDTVRAVGAYEPPLAWMPWWPRRARSAVEGVDPAEYAEGFFRRMVGDGAWDRLPEHTRQARRADGPALVAELSAIRADDPPFDVAELAVPAVFGRGEHSVPHHRRAAGYLAEEVAGAELVEIAGAAHGAHLTHPDAFAAFVRRVVARGVEGA